nr:MAG TPA: Transcriptional regulator fold, nan operon regulator [Caudoviricetes sp.]
MDVPKEYILLNRITGEIVKELSAGEFYIKERGDPSQNKQRTFTCPNGKVIVPGDDNELVYCRYKNAVIVNAQELQELNKELNTNERSIIETLVNYVSYHANIVTIENRTRFSTEELAEICGCSKPTFIRAAAKLSREYILISADGGKGKARQWLLNPLIAHRGKYYNVATRELFRKYRIRSQHMKEWGRYSKSS